MVIKVSLLSGAIASDGVLSIQSNGTTEAISISTAQVVTFANNPVITAGTANGVAYLNGSKVVTTGSALTFDGTNFGLNATPTSYGASYRTFALNATSGTQIDFQVGGTVKNYIYGSSATFQYDSVSNHVWSLSASEQMRLTSTGLGIGTSSPRGKLDVTGGNAYIGASGATTILALGGNTSSTGGFIYEDNSQMIISQVTSGPITFRTNSTDRMTLDASGNLGVGTTTMNNKVNITAGANDGLRLTSTSGAISLVMAGVSENIVQGLTNVPLTFYTNNTERARIDASGNLLVGTTSTSETSGTGIKIMPNGQGTNVGEITIVTAGTSSGQSSYNLYSTGAGAYRFYVDNAGTIHATSIVISAISDQRLKENVRDIDTGLSTIMALKPRRFDWKEGKGQDKKNAAGFIAQEFEEVFPECVSTSKAGADGIEYKNISHETLIPTLVKAIQELKAEFDAYKASHP